MTIATLFLKPADGRQVRDPHTRAPLSPDGEVKPDNSYWRRRLRDGDVLCVQKGGDDR